MTRYCMVIDQRRCIGCHSCSVACRVWNEVPEDIIYNPVLSTGVEGEWPNVHRNWLPTLCMHCEKPACEKVCPAGAISKREQDGIVTVDKDKCIGCHYCFFACPFGVPEYTEAGMDKCDACLGNGVKIDEGEKPHCVATCPTRALKLVKVSPEEKKTSEAALLALLKSGE